MSATRSLTRRRSRRSGRALNYTAPPDLARAIDEHDRFIDILRSAGATVHVLPRDPQHDARFHLRARRVDRLADGRRPVRDGQSRTRDGAGRAGERARRGRADHDRAAASTPPGRLEGGDVIWLDERTVAVGRGYRTNADGIRQLRALVGESVDVVEVPLPHWRGQSDVMHLMSLISPVDRDLAVVYSRAAARAVSRVAARTRDAPRRGAGSRSSRRWAPTCSPWRRDDV